MLLKDLPAYCSVNDCFEKCEYTKECNKRFKSVAPEFFSKFLDNMDVEIKSDSEMNDEESE